MFCLTLSDILCALCFTLYFALSLALPLASLFVMFPCSFRYKRSACSFFYIVGLDKQLYIELVANQHRGLVGLVWCYNIYLAFQPLQLVRITYCLNTGPSTVSFTIARPSCVTHSTDLTQASFLLQTL